MVLNFRQIYEKKFKKQQSINFFILCVTYSRNYPYHCKIKNDDMAELINRKEELKAFSDFARLAHDKANCKYDGKNYYTHVSMVEDSVDMYETVFLKYDDYFIARKGASGHDLIEDAQLTFNDIVEASNKRVARVILAVTDVHEENRLLRHLFTMGKTVKDYIAIIVKMCDMRSNGKYSKENGSSMYKKYVEEYQYRRPIFMKALKWYDKYLDTETLKAFWDELDEIHGFKMQV